MNKKKVKKKVTWDKEKLRLTVHIYEQKEQEKDREITKWLANMY